MTRFACKLGLVAAIVLGVAYFAAAPAQAHENRGRVVAPRVIVRGSNYYRPPVTVYVPPVTVYVPPTYPAYPYTPTYVPVPVPVPVAVTPTYPVYPYTPAYVPAPAPYLSVGAGCR